MALFVGNGTKVKIPSEIKLPLTLFIFLQGYTKDMDIWSVGCILAEMFCNKPLFPGKNYLDQISKIQEVLGTPTEEDTAFIKNAKAKAFLSSLPERPKVGWPKLFPKVS